MKKKWLYLFSSVFLFMAFPSIGLMVGAQNQAIQSLDDRIQFVHVMDRTIIQKPPDGWNPLTASDSELQKYNIPPRPVDKKARKGWEKVISGGKWVNPVFTLGKKKNTLETNNWSGIVTNGHYSRVIGKWIQPFAKNMNGPAPSFSSQWVGLGGTNSPYLIQIGTEADSYWDQSNGNYIWYEIVGTNMDTEHEVIIQNFPHQSGDQYYSDVWMTKSRESATAHFYIKDLTNGNVCSFAESGIDLSYVSGVESSAEWIVERPFVQGGSNYGWKPEKSTNEVNVYPYLTDFNRVPFTFNWMGNADTGYLEHPSFTSNKTDFTDMMDPVKEVVMAYPFDFEPSGNFTVYWNDTHNVGAGHIIYKDFPK